jgi:hypothetical protein
MHAGKEISGELVVSCCDCAEVLEGVEEPLDEVAFAVEHEIACAWSLAVCLGRNHRSDSAFGQSADERIGVVGLVTKQGVRLDIDDQRFRASQIMGLPCREHQLDRITKGIDEGVYFGSQSAAGSADRLLAIFFRAPALC